MEKASKDFGLVGDPAACADVGQADLAPEQSQFSVRSVVSDGVQADAPVGRPIPVTGVILA